MQVLLTEDDFRAAITHFVTEHLRTDSKLTVKLPDSLPNLVEINGRVLTHLDVTSAPEQASKEKKVADRYIPGPDTETEPKPAPFATNNAPEKKAPKKKAVSKAKATPPVIPAEELAALKEEGDLDVLPEADINVTEDITAVMEGKAAPAKTKLMFGQQAKQ